MEIVFFCVIVPDIDVLVLVETVGGQEIIGLVSGKSNSFGEERKSAEIVDHKCNNKQDNKFFLQGKSEKPLTLLFEKSSDPETDGAMLIDLKKNKKIDKKEQNVQPLPQVLPVQIKI